MRRMVRMIGLALALGGAAGAAAQTARQERLVAPRLDGWKIGFYRANTDQSIREEVPNGETVQNWTKMITTQRFSANVWKRTPAPYAREKLAQVTAACPGLRASPVTRVSISGRTAARFRADCPGYPGSQGKPETFFWLAIEGSDSLHVKQVAFRGGLAPRDAAWAQAFLSGVAICAAGDRSPACLR